jgi:hypothetical protein
MWIFLGSILLGWIWIAASRDCRGRTETGEVTRPGLHMLQNRRHFHFQQDDEEQLQQLPEEALTHFLRMFQFNS